MRHDETFRNLTLPASICSSIVHGIIIVTAGSTVLLLPTEFHLSFLLRILPFFLLFSFVVLLDGPGSTNSIVERRVLHAFHNGLTTRVDFFWIITPKGGRNGWSVIHPAFQFELSDDLVVPVGFRPTLGDLVSPHVGFVEIVDKVDGKLDQEVALHLGVVGIVEPIVKVLLRSKPQHGVPTVLDPKGLLPFFHDNRAKGNSRQDKALFANEFGLGKSRRLRSRDLLGEHSAVRIARILLVEVILVSTVGNGYHLTVAVTASVLRIALRVIAVGVRLLLL